MSLSNSKIKAFPETISNLNSLKVLELYSSQIITLPQSLSNLKSLEGISLKYSSNFTDFDSLFRIAKESSSIKWINIEGTNYNKENIEKFKRELKNIELIYQYED